MLIKRFLILVVLIVFGLSLGLGSNLFFDNVSVVEANACEAGKKEECNNKEEGDKLVCLNKIVAACEQMISESRKEQSTLNSTISVLNGNISIQEWKIQQKNLEISILERELEDIDQRLEGLTISLDRLTTLLVNRVQAHYKQQKINPLTTLFSSDSINKYVSQQRYFSQTSKQTADAMTRAEMQRTVYDSQKTLKEEKQDELDKINAELKQEQQQLINSRVEKQHLLAVTQNNEARFQDLLSQTRSEYEAILAIINRKGIDVESGPVKAGDTIARIIQGPSCNSNGTHLHFIVQKNNNVVNPFDYLKPIEHQNCSGSSCDSGDGDSFNPSGNWDWPILPTVRMSQGYGTTWAINNKSWIRRIYTFHNGIDINSLSSPNVKAVRDGTLFRGSYGGSGGCSLKYVRVDHDEDNTSTYYLHVNY
jgi:peptidoglycan hydrolase CwlO-like protein